MKSIVKELYESILVALIVVIPLGIILIAASTIHTHNENLKKQIWDDRTQFCRANSYQEYVQFGGFWMCCKSAGNICTHTDDSHVQEWKNEKEMKTNKMEAIEYHTPIIGIN